MKNEKDDEIRIHHRSLIGEIGRYGYWGSIIYDTEKVDCTII